MTLQDELQAAYDSEINVRLESLWDAGWRIAVFDSHNTPHWYDGTLWTLDEVADALRQLAVRHFPKSTYARNHRGKAATGTITGP